MGQNREISMAEGQTNVVVRQRRNSQYPCRADPTRAERIADSIYGLIHGTPAPVEECPSECEFDSMD